MKVGIQVNQACQLISDREPLLSVEECVLKFKRIRDAYVEWLSATTGKQYVANEVQMSVDDLNDFYRN